MFLIIHKYICITLILLISMYGFWVSRRLYKKRGFGYRVYYIMSILTILTSVYPLIKYNNPNMLTIFLGVISCSIGCGILVLRIGDIYFSEIHY